MVSRSVFRPLVSLAMAVVSVASVIAQTHRAVPQAIPIAAPQLLPYKMSLVAGGGSTATFTVGQTCPTSGLTATDKYGDGCLATEVVLTTPKYVTADTDGNIYFTDNKNYLVRRIDAATGVITTVAGGGASKAANATCAGALDAGGDGCLATAVDLTPMGLAISPLTGELYISDTFGYIVRKVNLTTGIISLAAGTPNSYGFYIWNGSSYTAGAEARLDAPYGLQFNAAGDLAFVEEYYKAAVLVLNTSPDIHTVGGVTIPAGAVAKVAGYSASEGVYCNSSNTPTSGTAGCTRGTFVEGAAANQSMINTAYSAAVDDLGNVYWANQFNGTVGKVDTSGTIHAWLGTQTSTAAVTNTRALGSTIPIGSNFGVATDALGNVYTSDSLKGWIWRVDAVSGFAWPIAGAGTSCNTTTAGDGCTVDQTKLTATASSSTTTYTNTPGVQGLFVDKQGSLILADSSAGLVHKIATNANFGTILPTNPTQTLDIHFSVNDGPSTYTLTTNTTNFTIGTANCTANTDGTTDCLLPVTATPTVEGAFSSNLQVTSSLGATSTFVLSGVLTTNRVASVTSLKANLTSTNPDIPVTLTATVTGAGTSGVPTGTVNFYDNGTQIGTAQTLNSSGQASIQATFALGSHSVTAVYDESLYYSGSTSSAVIITSTTPDFTMTQGTNSNLTVKQGESATTSFNVTALGLYSGSISFACTGLPANSSCSFSPAPLSIGTSNDPATPLVALTIKTQSATTASIAVQHTGVVLALLPGFALLLVGVRRKRVPSTILMLVLSAVAIAGMTGCGDGSTAKYDPTPAGTYTVTVTATGTASATSASSLVRTVPVTLTVTQ